MEKVSSLTKEKSKVKIFDKRIDEEIGNNFEIDPLLGFDIYPSPQNAARYLDVSVKFIYELIQSGELPSQPVGGRLKRIKKGILDEWLTSQAMKFGR